MVCVVHDTGQLLRSSPTHNLDACELPKIHLSRLNWPIAIDTYFHGSFHTRMDKILLLWVAVKKTTLESNHLSRLDDQHQTGLLRHYTGCCTWEMSDLQRLKVSIVY